MWNRTAMAWEVNFNAVQNKRGLCERSNREATLWESISLAKNLKAPYFVSVMLGMSALCDFLLHLGFEFFQLLTSNLQFFYRSFFYIFRKFLQKEQVIMFIRFVGDLCFLCHSQYEN